MHGTLIPVIAVGFAALVFAGPKAAVAAPATAALTYGETNAGVVDQVARKYRYTRKWRGGPYYRGYAYRHRPYYRPYAYYDYPYYDYPYYYRRGPGFSLWLGF